MSSDTEPSLSGPYVATRSIPEATAVSDETDCSSSSPGAMASVAARDTPPAIFERSPPRDTVHSSRRETAEGHSSMYKTLEAKVEALEAEQRQLLQESQQREQEHESAILRMQDLHAQQSARIDAMQAQIDLLLVGKNLIDDNASAATLAPPAPHSDSVPMRPRSQTIGRLGMGHDVSQIAASASRAVAEATAVGFAANAAANGHANTQSIAAKAPLLAKPTISSSGGGATAPPMGPAGLPTHVAPAGPPGAPLAPPAPQGFDARGPGAPYQDGMYMPPGARHATRPVHHRSARPSSHIRLPAVLLDGD